MSLFVSDDEDNPSIQVPVDDTTDNSINVQQIADPDLKIAGTIDIQSNLPLQFQQLILEQMLIEDCLLILAKGLGLENIVSNLLHVLKTPSNKFENEKRSLVILLNAHDEENKNIEEALTEISWSEDVAKDSLEEKGQNFTVINGESVVIKKRRQMYKQGGIISISSRIFIVDLLSGIVDYNLITGLVVLHAERISELSNESFIISYYRSKNKWGFLKCVTDEPQALINTAYSSSGGSVMNPLKMMLRNMRLEKCSLWPRFHLNIISSLNVENNNDKNNIGKVIEISVSMTESMGRIHIAILSAMKALLFEVKRHNPEISGESELFADLVRGDGEKITSDISIEDENSKFLDEFYLNRVMMLFKKYWHRISWTTKQLLDDLMLMKTLLNNLISFDSVEFYENVELIIDQYKSGSVGGRMNYTGSPWLMLDEANTIISFAKKRVVDKLPNQDGLSETYYLLEEPPKWEQLGDLIHEIFTERQKNMLRSGAILIMCSNSRTVKQLSQFLNALVDDDLSDEISGRKVMLRKFQRYKAWKSRGMKAVRNVNQAIKEDQDMRNKHAEMLQKSKADESESEADAQASVAANELNVSKTFVKSVQPSSKRRRTRGGSYVAQAARLHIADVVEEDDFDIEDNETGDEIKVDFETEIVIEGAQVEESDKVLDLLDYKNQIIIEKYDNLTDLNVLNEILPSDIIMYEPNLSFVRRIEIFQAENRSLDSKTHILYYKASVEEQRYLGKIKKEKETFAKLIREKGQLGKEFTNEELEDTKFIKSLKSNKSTRIAGGRDQANANKIAQLTSSYQHRKIIVDMREFRSSLPNILFRTGFEVIPCVLTVGDYIVSPRIVLERKSVPDLIGSFEKGNLYFQCERMFRYYEIVVLLIEFDENKSFSLNPFVEFKNRFDGKGTSLRNSFSVEKSYQNIRLKLIMLLLKYPKLRIIWSPSPYKTSEFIKELKINEKDPNVGNSVGFGMEDSGLAEDDVIGKIQENDNAIDLLKNIPGISENNYHQIVSHIRNITELASLDEYDISLLIGQENGRKVYNFLNQPMF